MARKYTETHEAERFLDALEHVSNGRNQIDILNGWSYSTGSLYEGVASGGGTVSLLLENPTDSGVYLLPTSRFSTGGKFYVQKKDNVTVDTAGTSQTINNRLLSDGNSQATVQKNPTTSGGNSWNQKVVGSGSAGANINGAVGAEAELILQPGENVLYEAVNPGSTNLDVSIDIDYIEIPIDEVDELGGE